jgi:hypothetical protein
LQGSTEVDTANGWDFGSQIAQCPQAYVAFAVKNTASSVVTLGSVPYAVSGTDSANFTLVNVPPDTVIPPGGAVTFCLQFDPWQIRDYAATMTVATDAATVSFPLRGSGVTSGTCSLDYSTDGGTSWNNIPGTPIVFATHPPGSAAVTYLFRITNTGGGPLGVPWIGRYFAISPHIYEFTSLLPTSMPLASGQSTTISILALYHTTGFYTDTVNLTTSASITPVTFEVQVQVN